MIDTLTEQLAPTAGAATAARNFFANLRALRRSQPALSDRLETAPDDVKWVFARDGSLTAMEHSNRWWAGCSLPRRAAEFMLRDAELPGTVVAFLDPIHAGQVRVALDRMLPGQALLALVPCLRTLRIIVACEDFSADIAAHRLYIAAGEEWEMELDRLLEENIGLPTPTQFIRPIVTDSAPADALVAPAQKIFAAHSASRAQRVRSIRQNWVAPGLRRICIVAPSHFRLWDDIGAALADALDDGAAQGAGARISVCRFDSDDPASASPAALAQAAAQCDAIVTPNTSRADLPDLIPDDMPWATWITTPRIPPVDKAGPRDTLLVADPDWKKLATQCGWKSDRVFVAGWPAIRIQPGEADEPTPPGVFRTRPDPFLAIISDTRLLDPPKRVMEFSSHRVLWETIRDQLVRDPFALDKSPDHYLSDCMRQARVEENGFDRTLFLDGVILHAWQQGIARALLRAGISVKLLGNGWNDLDDLGPHAIGPVESRQQLSRAIQSATALVHVRPIAHAHPIESTNKPIIRGHLPRDLFLRDARLALSGRIAAIRRSVQPLSTKMILKALAWDQ